MFKISISSTICEKYIPKLNDWDLSLISDKEHEFDDCSYSN